MPTNRKFGMFFSVLFIGLGAYLAWVGRREVAYFLFIIGVSFGLVSTVASHWLLPLNRAWFRLGLLLGRIVNPIVLALIFFLLITPCALVIRLIKRDVLRLRMQKHDSYWVERSPSELAPESFKNQY